MVNLPYGEEAKATIRKKFYTPEDRALITDLRSRVILFEGFRELLSMDLTPEVREKITSIKEQIEMDREFVRNA
jgi:hypothetical protein